MRKSFYQQRLNDMRTPASVTVVSTATQYSKLKLETSLALMGKKPALDAFLGSVEVAPGYTALEAWKSATVISDNYPNFGTYYAAVLEALGMSKEEGDNLLAGCIAE